MSDRQMLCTAISRIGGAVRLTEAAWPTGSTKAAEGGEDKAPHANVTSNVTQEQHGRRTGQGKNKLKLVRDNMHTCPFSHALPPCILP